jgi:hypothetical protein
VEVVQQGSEIAVLRLARSTVGVSANAALTVRPTESEIAAVAYRLWLDNGCPVGSDQEIWFRAEAMLKNARAVKREDLSKLPLRPRSDTRTESEMVGEFRWQGHWEAWEMEWGDPHWIWD